MSIRTLTSLAVVRDNTPTNRQIDESDGSPGGTTKSSFGSVLTSAIPTEPLSAYTAIIAVVGGAVSATHPREYLPFRWACFIAFLVLIVVAVALSYRAKKSKVVPGNTRVFPWAEGSAALLAGAAWGLAMPGSALYVQLHGTLRQLTVGAIIIGGGALLTLLFGPQLRTATKTAGTPAAPAAPAAPQLPAH